MWVHSLAQFPLLSKFSTPYFLVCEYPTHFLSFGVLTCPSLCALQQVSAPCLLALFFSLNLSLPLCFPVCECPSPACFFIVLNCPSLCALQEVSAPCSLTHFFSLNLSFSLHSLASGFPSLAHFLLLSCPDLTFPLSSLWVALSCKLSFTVLTCPFLCALQKVSVTCSYTFFCYTDLFFPLHFTGSECPLLTCFCWLSWLLPFSALSSWCVPLHHTLSLISWLVSVCPPDSMCLTASASPFLVFDVLLTCVFLTCSPECELSSCQCMWFLLASSLFPSLCCRHYSPN